ncbi:ribosome assembly protein METTL17, mitochondrial isoform X2 [Antennarius striatus]|uniref:ribosome assembly protein METTL17, mitochondrial isoform X2 n=1 Tax=Antennarius striatus TaxID=241820 RepID=UPI0035B03CCD
MALRSLGSCVVCQKATVLGMMCRRMSAAADLQPQVNFLKGQPHKKHPGVTKLKNLHLPDRLQTAALSIIQGAQVSQLPELTRSLTNFLWSRKRAVEDFTLKKKAQGLEKELWEKAKESGVDIDGELLEERIRKKVLSELRRTTYHWTMMKYDEELGVVYMAARLAGGYAAVKRALNEIKKKDPSFAPQTLLDFGSGLGTVTWASHSYWGDTLKEMVCVDSSGQMNILAERLLKGDDENAEPHIKHVYFRQFLPVSPKVQFDLVTAAFTLSELPSRKQREETVLTLWRKTNSYLVLVENGTKEGHQILMEARETLLMTQDKVIHDPRPTSVFAPCPHELQCPKLAMKTIFPCNFQQLYHPLHLSKHKEQQTEEFSYLILTRGEPLKAKAEGVDWARLIAPVLRRSKHVHCRLCCADGQLQHLVVTANKHSKDMYRCARSSNWGDEIPVIQKDQDDDHQTD